MSVACCCFLNFQGTKQEIPAAKTQISLPFFSLARDSTEVELKSCAV